MSHQYSRARRWSRILVWLTFGIVLTLRILIRPEPAQPPERGGRFFEGGGNPGRRFRRPPARIQPPVSAVPTNLWRIAIEIAPADVETLRGYAWNGWGGRRPEQRPEVLATVREGGAVYTNVAIHLKGAAGSFRPIDDKPALTLNFSKHVPGQKFHGYSKISLNNSVQDPSFISEVICRELFDAAGVPVPRADHATVVLNKRDLGLYVLTEGWGKPFLKRYFKNVSGNLYDGGFLQEITGELDTNSGDNPSDRSDLDRLAAAAGEPNGARRRELLTASLDIDRFYSMIAMEIITCHWDGYALNRNNFRVFHDAEANRMVFMPHGLDQMFGVMRSSPESPIDPPMQGLDARAVLTMPGGYERYLQRVGELRTNIFIEAKLTNRVHEIARRIRPTLAAYAPDLAEEHDRRVADLNQRIVDRARSISEQLAEPHEPIAFDADGVFSSFEWKPRTSGRRQSVVDFDRTEKDGQNLLRIKTGPGGGSGAWFARVLIGAGSYRFEGNVQTHDIGDGGGAALRILGAGDARFRSSDEKWSRFSHDFTIAIPVAEIELMCELRSAGGEAWFDADSLRLVRVEGADPPRSRAGQPGE
jgi:hypothetical protein